MVRIVGDVHGHVDTYVNIIKNYEYSLQVGDMGFKEHYDRVEKLANKFQIDMSKHLFIPGNHDDYDHLPKHSLTYPNGKPHGIEIHGGLEFFWVRGGLSVDKHWRTEGVSWWPNEELDYLQANECVEDYERIKPKIVISHDCPTSIYVHVMTNPDKAKGSQTSKLLQALYDIHQPDAWYFGHHHRRLTVEVGQTTFECLGELDYLDIEVEK